MLFRGSFFFLMTLLLVACGNMISLSGDTTQLTFSLGEDVAAIITSRQTTTDEGGGYKVKVTLSGGSEESLEKTATDSTLATTTFEFKDIPLNSTVKAACTVYSATGITLWTGSSGNIEITDTTNRASITLSVHSGIVVWKDKLGIASSPAGVESATGVGSVSYNSLSFTFGNEGELYYLNTDENSIMVSYRNAQGEYGESSKYCDGNITGSLTRDKITDELYGLNDTIVVRLKDGTSYESSSDTGGMDSPKGLAVEDDVFYLYSEIVNIDTPLYSESSS